MDSFNILNFNNKLLQKSEYINLNKLLYRKALTQLDEFGCSSQI